VGKLAKERRRHLRVRCILPAEIIELNGEENLVENIVVHDFSRDGLRITINFRLNPNSILDSKIYLPEKNITASLLGEIVWSKLIDSRFEVGLKIKQMDDKAKDEILDWLYPQWVERSH
jgi:hypothetical protein